MAQIKLPLEFFRKERDTGYANWRKAFWRELLSNSLDAGATIFEVRHFPATETSTEYLTITDNGSGMSAKVCEEVYLSIGRSTKDAGEGSVGGFGRARILTCFSMKSYAIHGDGYVVEGKGAEYEIELHDTPREGLKLFIEPDMAGVRWKDFLGEVLAECDLPHLEVTFNGDSLYKSRLIVGNTKPLPVWLDQGLLANVEPAIKGFVDEFSEEQVTAAGARYSFGQVGFVPLEALGDAMSQNNGHCIFRVNGMAMFSVYHGIKKGALVIELDPRYCRRVLTANRDGLKAGPVGVIREVVKAFHDEGTSSLDDKFVSETSFYGDFANLRLFNRRGVGEPNSHGSSPERAEPGQGSVYDKLINQHAQTYSGEAVFFSIRSKDEKLVAVANSWRPGFQTPAMERFLRAWVSACEISLKALAAARPSYTDFWMPGLTFTEDALASHTKLSCSVGPVHVLSINPINHFTYAPRYNLASPSDRQNILASAMHEVAHILESSHDVDFAGVLTDMISHIDFNAFKTASRLW